MCVCQALFLRVIFKFLHDHRQQGDHPCVVSDGPTKRPQHMRICSLINCTYLPFSIEWQIDSFPTLHWGCLGSQVVHGCLKNTCFRPCSLPLSHMTDLWTPQSIIEVCENEILYNTTIPGPSISYVKHREEQPRIGISYISSVLKANRCGSRNADICSWSCPCGIPNCTGWFAGLGPKCFPAALQTSEVPAN